MKIAVLALTGAVWACPAVAQGVTGKDILPHLDNNKSAMQLYFLGIAHGLFWANDSERKGEKDFCPPKKIAIQPEQYIDIFKRYLNEDKTAEQYPVGLIMIEALKQSFPCPK